MATQSVIAACDDRFDVHVLQHVLLGMVAPFLLALGAPVTLALQASTRSTQIRLLRVLHSPPVRIISHPVVACTLFAFTLFVLYFSPLYGLSVHTPWIHEAVHVHFFVVGCLFFWVTVGLDPVAWRIPYGARLALVIVTVPLHAFLGLALLSTTTPLDGSSSITGRLTAGALVAVQHRGAAIMWVVGDLVGLAAGGVVLAQWMRHEERRGDRLDRALDAADARDRRRRGTTCATLPDPPGSGSVRAAMTRTCALAIRAALLLAVTTFLTGCDTNFGFPDPITSQGEKTLELWRIFFVIAIAVVALIWGLVAWSVIRYRRRSDAVPRQRQTMLKLEIFYTVVPLVLVGVLFALTLQVNDELTTLKRDPDVRVQVVGFQWQWQFHYPGEGVTTQGTPDHPAELVLPVGRTVQFHLVADDVIHSFWVPEFLEKRDLIPGVDQPHPGVREEAGRRGSGAAPSSVASTTGR